MGWSGFLARGLFVARLSPTESSAIRPTCASTTHQRYPSKEHWPFKWKYSCETENQVIDKMNLETSVEKMGR